MCGPGAGALWGRESCSSAMAPFLTGGEMISTVALERTTWNELPWKFEAGTPAIAECVGLGAAVDYLQRDRHGGDPRPRAGAHRATATTLLRSIPGVTVYGPPPDAARRRPLVQRRGHAPARRRPDARRRGVCVRAGHHCTQPVMRPLRRRRDDARERLPLQHDRRPRPAGRGASSRSSARSASDTPGSDPERGRTLPRRNHGRLLPREHPRPLPQPAQPRASGRARRDGRGREPALRRRAARRA